MLLVLTCDDAIICLYLRRSGIVWPVSPYIWANFDLTLALKLSVNL